MENTVKYVMVESSRYKNLLSRIQPGNDVRVDTNTTVNDSKKEDIQPPSPSIAPQHPLPTDVILACLPKQQKSRGGALINHFKTIENVNWDGKGRLLINSQLIQNSQIIDLIKFCLVKCSFTPIGWINLAEVLKRENIPQCLLTNPVARQTIAQSPVSDQSREIKPEVSSNLQQSGLGRDIPPGISQNNFKATSSVKVENKNNNIKARWLTRSQKSRKNT